MQQNKIYVGNLPYTVDEQQLRDLFTGYGEIDELAMIKDRETGQPKGFAFITFAKQQAAEQALELNGNDVGGRAMKVNMATEKPARSPRSNGGGARRW